MRILAMVDEQQLQLSAEIELLPQDVWPSWRGDLADSWPHQRRWKLEHLIRLMVEHSDNTAVEALFRIAGAGNAMKASLSRLFHGELLSSTSTIFLTSALEASTPGKNRLSGLLPPKRSSPQDRNDEFRR